jgi:hypothetical protein
MSIDRRLHSNVLDKISYGFTAFENLYDDVDINKALETESRILQTEAA